MPVEYSWYGKNSLNSKPIGKFPKIVLHYVNKFAEVLLFVTPSSALPLFAEMLSFDSPSFTTTLDCLHNLSCFSNVDIT